jgi:hypothetical protein
MQLGLVITEAASGCQAPRAPTGVWCSEQAAARGCGGLPGSPRPFRQPRRQIHDLMHQMVTRCIATITSGPLPFSSKSRIWRLFQDTVSDKYSTDPVQPGSPATDAGDLGTVTFLETQVTHFGSSQTVIHTKHHARTWFKFRFIDGLTRHWHLQPAVLWLCRRNAGPGWCGSVNTGVDMDSISAV